MCFVCIFIRISLYPGLLYGCGNLYCDSHQVQPLSAPSAFPSIYLNSSLFFSFKKIAYIDYSIFKSDDIAFLLGL